MGKNNNNYWVRSSFFALSQRISIPLFGVGTFLVLVRSLSKEEMGAWVLFVSIITVVEVARNGLIKAALVKFFTEAQEKDRKYVLSSSFYINMVFTALTQCGLVLSGQLLSDLFQSAHLDSMFLYYSISAVLYVPFSHFEYVLQANLNFKGIFYSYFVKQGWFFIVIAVLLLLLKVQVELVDLVLLQSAGIFLGVVSSYVSARRYLKHDMSFSPRWIRKLWAFGKYGLFTNVSNAGLTTSDHVLIGGILSTASVAIHNVATRITNVFVIPSVAIADVLFPKTVEANEAHGSEEVRNLYQKAVGATLVPMLPVVICIQFFPEIFIELLAGEKYLDATQILRVTIIGILLLPFVKQFGTVMNAIGKPHFNFYFVLCIAVINTILNYIFINEFGIIGGASATLLSYFIAFIASQIILKRTIDLSTRSIFTHLIEFYCQIYLWIKMKIKSK